MLSLGSKLSKKYPQLLQYKPGIDFLARLFFIGIFILFIKILYGINADINGYLYLPGIEPFSPIELLRAFLLKGTHVFLILLGYPAQLQGWVVGIPGGSIIIETPCLGINICFVFITLVAAFPSPHKWYIKFLYIFTGLVLIQFLNLCRMVAMVFVVKNRYSLPMEHHDLFNLIIYIVVFSLFYYYISLTSKKNTFA